MSVSYGPKLGLIINALTGDTWDAPLRALLRALDQYPFLCVINRTTTAPPGSPANGDAYIVATGGSGAWSGQDKSIAVWTTDNPVSPSGVWEFHAPQTGWLAWSVADAALYAYSASAWGVLINPASAVTSVAGRTGAVVIAEADVTSLVADLALKAPLASPALTGTPTAPTAAALDNSTKIGTTGYADAAVAVEKTRALAAEAALAPPVTSVAGRTGAVVIAESDVTSLVADLAATEKTANKGAVSGYAGLDSGGHVPLAQLPASIVGALQYQGVWDATANSPALASGVGTTGFFYKVSTAGSTTLDGNTGWHIGDLAIFDGTVWDKVDNYEAVTSVAGRTGAVVIAESDVTSLVSDLALKAPLASPALSGTPTAPTPAALDNSTKLATTAYDDAAVAVEKARALAAEALKAPLASPALTGTPTAPTPAALDNSTKIGTTGYADAAVAVEKTRALAAEAALAPPVTSVAGRTGAVVIAEADVTSLVSDLALKAPLASPALTGTPTAPTAAALDSSTKIGTTAYADAAVGVEKTRALAAEALLAPLASPALTGAPTAPTAAALDSSTKIGTTAYADAAVGVEKTRALAAEALLSPLANPVNTGSEALVNTTAATSTVAQSSPISTLSGKYWTGAASATDSWTFQVVLANGTNGQSALTIAHTGSTAFNYVVIQGAYAIGSLTLRAAASVAFGWSSTSDPTATSDTTLSRNAAGVVQVGTSGGASLGTVIATGGFSVSTSGPATQGLSASGATTLVRGTTVTLSNSSGTVFLSATATGVTLTTLFLTASGGAPTSAGTAGTAGQIIYFGGLVYFCSVTGAAGSATWNKLNMTAV